MISCGADIYSTDQEGNTPLWVAAMHEKNSNNAIASLIKHGADPKQKNNHGVTPIEISPEHFANVI